MCHNGPYQWRNRWSTTINAQRGIGNNEYGNLTAANFSIIANRLKFTIPATSTTDENLLIVNLGVASKAPGAASIQYSKYFISYRVMNNTPLAYDSGLPKTYHQRVFIHLYDGWWSDLSGESFINDTRSQYIAELPMIKFPNETVWTAPFVAYDPKTGLGGGFRVRAVRVGGLTADVEVCRMYAKVEGTRGSQACAQGLDIDW